jgi:serine/threonine protein kinase
VSVASISNTPVQPLAIGSAIGADYRVKSVLSSDANSITYTADDVHLGIPFCIKEYVPAHARGRAANGALLFDDAVSVQSDQMSIARFVREARALVRFHHPNIIRAHRVLETNATAYIVLDFEETLTLEEWLNEIGRAPKQAELDRIVGRLLEALAVIHDAGVTHRDIRPENIFLRSDLSPVVTGFAYVATAEDDDHVTTLLTGSSYVAPELCDGEGETTKPASDMYGLAATLYRALTGNAPPRLESRYSGGDLSITPVSAEQYRPSFLSAVSAGLRPDLKSRLSCVQDWLSIDTPIDPALLPAATRVETPRPQETTTESRRIDSFASRFLHTFDRLPDPALYAGIALARAHLPLAILCAFMGIALYGSGWSFAFSAILQVIAIFLFWGGGILTLYQLITERHGTPSSLLAKHADEASRRAALMACCILGVLAFNPILAAPLIVQNPNEPVQTLSFIIGVPLVLLLMFVTTSARLGGATGWLFGAAVGLAGALCLVIFSLYAYVLVSQFSGSLTAAPLATTYLFIVAPVATGTLCVYLFYCRWRANRMLDE